MTKGAAPPGWEVWPDQGFGLLIGPFWRRAAGSALEYGFRVEERHLNPHGIMHGGMMLTFADQVLGATVWHAIGEKPCATITLNSNFLAPAKLGDWLEAKAEISRRGRSVVFVGGRVLCGDRILLTAEGVWKILGHG